MTGFPCLIADAAPIDYRHAVIHLFHIGAAMLAVGGAVFQLIALHPALQSVDAVQRRALRESIVQRWSTVVFVCIGVLLVSGLYNFIAVKIPMLRDNPDKGLYHGLFGLKFLLALAAFHAAAVLALPGPKGEKYRDKAGFWLKYLVVTLALTFVVAVLMGSFR